MDFDDRPPAGTPCLMCRDKGHFCQADEWTAGDSGNGICADCLDGKPCPTILARKPPAEPEDIFKVPTVSRDEQLQNQREIIIGLYDGGQTIKQIVYSCGYREEMVREIIGDRKRPPSATPPPVPKPAPAKPRNTYKPKSDEQAREMLKQGYPIQVIMDRTELSKNTILTIKRELGLLLPPEQKSGTAPIDYKVLANGIAILDPGQTTAIAFPSMKNARIDAVIFENNLRATLAMHPDFKDRQIILHRANGHLVGGWVPKGTFKIDEKPLPPSNAVPYKKRESKWGPAIALCLKLECGESTVIALPENGSRSSLCSMLSQHKEACHDRWKLESLRGDDTKCCVTRVERRPSPFDETPEPQARVRRAASDVGRPPVVDRQKIETLIEEGTSVRSAAELAEVSTNTVQRIKREMSKDNIYTKTIAVAKEELAKIQPEIERLRLKESQLIAAIQALEAL